jgi:hypothetical protein
MVHLPANYQILRIVIPQRPKGIASQLLHRVLDTNRQSCRKCFLHLSQRRITLHLIVQLKHDCVLGVILHDQVDSGALCGRGHRFHPQNSVFVDFVRLEVCDEDSV